MGAAQVASGGLALLLFKIINRRTVAFIGFIMLAIGTWLQGFMISEIGLNEIIWPQIIRGLSAQLCFLPLVLLSIGYLSTDKIKDGSGLYSLMNRLGAAIGIAASNTLFELKITENYLEISNLTSKALNHSQLFLLKLNNLIPKYLSNSPEKLKIVSEILYKIGIEEASAMAFNQIMLIMGIMALIVSPLIFLVKGLKKE
jgi:DHA2 family multidrug resistance protein